MLNCTGKKIPLICVFAAIAIVFIHGLSLAVAPGEPEVREPEARAWATAENEPARPKAGVVFLAYSDPRIDGQDAVRGRIRLHRRRRRLLKRVLGRLPVDDPGNLPVLHTQRRLGRGADVLVLVPETGTHLPRDARR